MHKIQKNSKIIYVDININYDYILINLPLLKGGKYFG